MVSRAVIWDDKLDHDAETLSPMCNGLEKEKIKMVLRAVIDERKNHKRLPKSPPPENGICLRAASRKYKIPDRTISRWVRSGFLPILERTRNELYIDEILFAKIIKSYNSLPDSGRRTINKAIAAL